PKTESRVSSSENTQAINCSAAIGWNKSDITIRIPEGRICRSFDRRAGVSLGDCRALHVPS
ncbi:MAG: hypothetical protein ACE5FV_14875, partial [Woeseia sp.]